MHRGFLHLLTILLLSYLCFGERDSFEFKASTKIKAKKKLKVPFETFRGGLKRSYTLRQPFRKQERRFILSQIISYTILQKMMVSIGPIEFINSSNVIIHIFWILSIISKNDNCIEWLKTHFLLPLSWKELKRNPFSLFGSAFSHFDTGHLLANSFAFSVFAPLALKRAGISRFSHLYLMSILASSLVAFLWNTCYAPDFLKSGAQHCLGASGAISSVTAYACLSHKDRVIKTDDGKEFPLIYWFVGYVLSDVAGLIRQDTLMTTSKLVQEGDMQGALHCLVKQLIPIDPKKKQSKITQEEKIDSSVGYEAHLGGVLGGLLFYLVCFSAPLLFETRFVRNFARKYLLTFITTTWYQKILNSIKIASVWLGLVALTDV